jgi:hypothetical protein
MDPQNYAERTSYRRPAAWYLRFNRLGVWMTSAGLAPADAVTLIVRGRSSGKPRALPIIRTRHDGADYLVALAGEAQWVRNVRAAAGVARIRRRGTSEVRLVELPTDERPPVISAYLDAARTRGGEASYRKQARFYFGLDPDPSPHDIADIAEYYPVFRIDHV